MALQVWLPLTKDLRQQGLSNVTATNNGAIFDSAGKLGGCYYFDGTSSRISCSSYTWDYPLSISAWFKPTDVTSSNTQYWLSYNTASGGTAGHAIAIGIYSAKLSVWYGGTVRSLSTTLSNNVWYHITLTIDENKKVITYLNGNQIDTVTFSSNNPGSTWFTIGARSNSSTGGVGGALYFYKGYMNDVRFYNHCLSPMEVKELAKGLVLHYPLNRNGWGQENLASQYIMPGGNNPGSTSTAGRTNYYGDYGIIIPATENADTYFSIWYPEPLENGTVYTLSAEVSGLINGSYYNFPLFAQGNTSMGIIRFDHNGLNTLTFTMNYTGTITTATVNGKTYYRMFMDDNGRAIATGQGAITIKNIKLEEGSIATPWCPNSSDTLATTLGLNGTTEYDCSGFCNNGTKTGTLTYTSDTSKYCVSTKIAAASSGIKLTNFSIGNIWSMSVWFKYPSQDSTGWKGIVLLNNNGGDADLQFGNYINCSGNAIQYSANGKYTTGVTFTYGVWHHIVNTYDGTTLKCYLDGEYKTSVTPGQTLSRSNLGIGYRAAATDFSSYSNSATNLQISDVRIYATALSADDVKSLYQNSAYIDSSGNVYGAVHSEV